MSKRNPREILAQLISLRNNAGTSLYTRLKLADQLLSDKDWVEDPSGGGGDVSRAIDRIEQDCFGPEAGMSLPAMLEVLAAVPQESAWRQNRYNLKKMWEEMKERQGAGRPAPKSRTMAPVEARDLREENHRLKEELKEALRKIKEQDKEIRHLRRSVKRMKRILDGFQIA